MTAKQGRQIPEINEDALLEFMREGVYRPLTFGELAGALGARGKARKQLRRVLEQLESDGRVIKTRTDRYGLPERMNLVVGRLQGHARGFAFVIPERDEDDVFIPADSMGGAMHNDRVVARLRGRARDRQRAEGEIIRVLERANTRMAGRLERHRRYAFVTPADARITHDVFVPPKGMGRAKTGDMVVVEISRWPDGRRSPEGRVAERLGLEGEPGVDIELVMFKYGLDPEFDADARREAEAVPQAPPPRDLEGRRDLRDMLTFTIDGADAKDLDDAVSLQALDGGRWRLGVHIADVSHYVAEGSALDREARRRGTSVYLVDRVVPMLPEQLSNGICSLHPEVERLTLSVLIDLDEEARVVDYEITPAVIRSDARLTYDQVYRMVGGGEQGLRRRYRRFVPVLERMHELSQALFARRLRRGSIDFDFPEAKLVLDEAGKPREIRTERRNLATQIIEEFMILCNEVVATHHQRLEMPFLYRVHEPPEDEAIEGLEEFLSLFGHRLKRRGRRPTPQHLQRLLERIKGTKEEYLISTVVLRAMERARYAAENAGHFGLASPCYGHFTSPIRRYPDLTVHRITREVLQCGKLERRRLRHVREQLPEIAVDCSVGERQADEAERETVDLKKAEFMEQHLGDEFTGIISGVMSFGLFVQLPNTVEGLVHVSTMSDDYYQHDEARYVLAGERTGRTFQLGDEIRVQLVRVNRQERLLDFHLVEEEEAAQDKAGDAGAGEAGTAHRDDDGGAGRGGKRRRRRRRRSGRKRA